MFIVNIDKLIINFRYMFNNIMQVLDFKDYCIFEISHIPKNII